MKKIISLIICIILISLTAVSVYAKVVEGYEDVTDYVDKNNKPTSDEKKENVTFYDGKGYPVPSDYVDNKQKIEKILKKAADKLDVNIYVFQNFYVNIYDYEESYRELYKLQYGDEDGIIVYTITPDDVYLYDTYGLPKGTVFKVFGVGETEKYINDYGKEKLSEIINETLNGKYDDGYKTLAKAYKKFADALIDFERESSFLFPYSNLNKYRTFGEKLVLFIVKLILIFIISFVFVKKYMKKHGYSNGRKRILPKGGVCTGCGSVYDEIEGGMICPFCDKAKFMPGEFKHHILPESVGEFTLSKKDFLEMFQSYVSFYKLFPKDVCDDLNYDNVKKVFVKYEKYDDILDNPSGLRYCFSDNKGAYYRRKENLQYHCFDNIKNLPHMKDRKVLDKQFFAEEAYIPEEMLKKVEHLFPEKSEKINVSTELAKKKAFFAPFYRMDILYGKKLYSFFMNGQSGDFAGELFADKKKLGFMAIKIAVAAYIILSPILNFI